MIKEKRMLRKSLYRSLLSAGVLVFLVASVASSQPAASQDTDRWQRAIDAFVAADKASPPKPGGILFLGSSSIRGWDTDKWFPDLGVVNRGFGGSQISDSLRHFDELVVPHAPKTLVFYAGDNDINAGKKAERVLDDFTTLFGKVHHHFPDCRVVFISIKPSLARWELVGEMRRANAMIAKLAEKEPLLAYLDIDAPMIGKDGKPRPELFVDDGLHMTDEGYALWTEKLMPLLSATD